MPCMHPCWPLDAQNLDAAIDASCSMLVVMDPKVCLHLERGCLIGKALQIAVGCSDVCLRELA